MNEKYFAGSEINKLLESEKTSEEVEKEATELISKKLYEYALEEIKEEVFLPEDAEKFEKNEHSALLESEIDKNFSVFIEKIADDPKLDFIRKVKKEFPDGKFYLVGGAVRDGFLGKPIKDYDLVVSGIPGNELEKILSGFGEVDLLGKNFGVYKFKQKHEEEYIDLALPRQEKSKGSGAKRDFEIESNWQLSIEEDLSRRDLTMNAMALDLDNKSLLDPFGGKKDLISETIKTVGIPEHRFSEDLSRILRCIRFAAKMSYQIEPSTFEAIKSIKMLKTDENGQQIVPWETIGAELEKSFYANPLKTFDLLDKSGLMTEIFPEIERMKGLPQPPEHHKEGDVFTHTKLVLKAIPKCSSLSLIFAAFLHDVGKPDVFNRDEKGKITFYNHAEKSAEIAQKICDRLKMKTELSKRITTLIEKHMTMYQIENMTKPKIYKLLFEAMPRGETSHELIRLNRSDLLGSISGEKKWYDIARRNVKEFSLKSKNKEIKPFINGDDLIAMGLKPGPTFKRIIDKIRDEQIEGNILTREQALDRMRVVKEEIINA